MERAYEILAGGDIDPRLAADGTVDHREQSRRNLIEIDAAQPRRGGISTQITDHAATDREQCPRTIEFVFSQKIENAAESGQRLRSLTRFKRQHRRTTKHRSQDGALRPLEVQVGQNRSLSPCRPQTVDLLSHVDRKIPAETNHVTALA